MNRADEIMMLMRDGADAPAVFAALKDAFAANGAEARELIDMLVMAERRHGKPDAPVVIVRQHGLR
jgi:hypothetical protein